MSTTKKPPSPSNCYGYSRVSTGQQRDSGLSLDDQQRKIKARCTEMGWELATTFVDGGISGSTPLGKRPQGAQLLAALRPGDTIICARMDRMFRSSLDALTTIQSFKKRKISLWLLDLGGDVSGNGISELIMTILAAVATFEHGLISERIADAKRQLRHRGRHQDGSRPFGYRIIAEADGKAGKLAPEPAEQAVIAEILALRQDGGTLMGIRDAVRTKGFPISHQTVARVIERHAAAVEAAA